MRISELLRTALRSLRANKKRSFLTIIGIMIGIAAVITILGIGDGITQTMYDKFGNNAKQGQQTTEIYYMPQRSTASTSRTWPTSTTSLAVRSSGPGSNTRPPTSTPALIWATPVRTLPSAYSRSRRPT